MKKIIKKIKEKFKSLKSYHYIRYFITLWLGLMLFLINNKWLYLGALILAVVAFLVVVVSNATFRKRADGNGIIYGGRRKGKGLLLNAKIKADKTKPFVNVPYFKTLDRKRGVIIDGKTLKEKPYKEGDYYHTELLTDLDEYFNSIYPLTINDFINGIDTKIFKNEKFEGRNVYIDDVGVYLANWADTLLKRKYPSLPPFLAINGHLYNAYCLVTTQDRERPYKILKELQTDTSIKAIKTRGWSWFWLCIPVLHNFVYTKYIYHELPKSSDMLPFKAKGVANEAVKGAYLTSGQATKEVYEATHGKIRYGFVLQLKRSLNYDTRYFHKIVYGYPALKSNNKSAK
ncbi:MAG: hypothetical protein GX794_00200 [Acholeplasmataceae bacterium]|nr:hypothetical protein [Acholeplasmataceae bacterium]